MPENRDEQIRRIIAETRASRERFNRSLVADNADIARRLSGAYRTLLPAIDSAVADWQDALSPNYPDVTNESDRLALETLEQRIQRELATLEGQIIDATVQMQTNGAASGYQAGLSNLRAGGVSVGFHEPSLEAIKAAINYVDSPAFRLRVGQIGNWHSSKIADVILAAVAQGENPRRTAAILKQYFEGGVSPLQDALRLARTTQIYSARTGNQMIYAEMGVEQWLWSANLGNPRTCLACIAMHGTLHPIDQLLNDHHNGRCAAVPVTPLWAEFGLDGGEPAWQTGVQWLEEQPFDTQRQAMGPELFDAWRMGLFDLRPDTVVETYHNDIFGNMRRRKPNMRILGF